MPASRASDQDTRRIASGLTAVLPALHRAIDRRVLQDLPFPRLPDGQLALLRYVAEHDGVTVRAAADALLVKPNNVSALVTQLAAQGLLERRQDAADKRVAHLHLTAEARRRVAEVGDLVDGYVVEALHALTDGDLDAIGSALGALQGLAQRIHPAAD
ncbi:MarR family transcriptional regulator [Streptomyces sp. WAC 06783]|uniref:MarR family winged helix-turn-helix transcriptional regulator n=1 Tax=unclassified Streptomyces TaxID=2593676 RepID=UPI000F746A05|nr:MULTISPECIES: MarR family transcriptional regulator [unclassified Streptomyces]RSO09663.1 MarR family transcriptional regulator [Streptomyces sp. WAC 06783]RSO21615.1 MarR family transcriptional regulator [Streptomyces sp. WAC 06725]